MQIEIVKIIDPDAPFHIGMRDTNFLASIAMASIALTTPGKTPKAKDEDLKVVTDILIRAVDLGIEEQDEEFQAAFHAEFMQRWEMYLLPVAYLLGDHEKYLQLEKPVAKMLAESMEFEPSLVWLLNAEAELNVAIRTSASKVWPLFQLRS
ncbi:hypothetical protein [Devosia elaeis]|uniref:Uncharacterized protein n=1 Tax=Devosia elaeis TaxID=1770058 RepID=A0A178HTV2_9HYPH|nr:hypothetical protein [Devosia elaeis]OAM75464.1 hypothetical protein A3840_14680 [Devosia elaeis]